MCAIWSLIRLKKKNLDMVKLFEDFMNLKNRGPDSSHFQMYNNVIIGFHRLGIIDPKYGSDMPFIFEDENRTVIFMANAEFYNHKELSQKYNLSNEIKNDCRVIFEIYIDMLKNNKEDDFNRFIKEEVNGEFACIIHEFDNLKNLRKIIVFRDELGVRPLYYSPNPTDTLLFTSEIKSALSFDGDLKEFPPGHIFTYTLNELDNFSCDKYNYSSIYDVVAKDLSEEEHLKNVQTAVLNSVRRRLNADKPFGFLLSGGVDSSLVAALSAKILQKPIRTFCCSIKGEDGKGVGTDLKYARMVADHIGSNHTEVLFTPEEGLAAIPDVIRTIGSWDTTTVRASVVQYLVCKYIGEHTDCKVVMVGETADEVCSSYLFNWYAPSGKALHQCAKEYVKNIHNYDVKRADRCICRWGLEGRVPFSDSEFIEAYWTIPSEKRMPVYKNMEKWWLRKAFDGSGILPNDVLWRTKAAQSDACSSEERSWYQIIQEWVEHKVTDEEMTAAKNKYPYCTPTTKEAYYFRKVFCEIFGEHRQNIINGYWQAKWNKDGNELTHYTDPSARTLDIYKTLNN
jgi:asparagine synthase (glutamine-hydrolysing)